MYIKLFGCLVLIGSASAMGFLKAEELTERVKKMQELKRMILLLQGELRFHRAALSEAFENVAVRISCPLRNFLEKMAEELEAKEGKEFEEIWNYGVNALLSEKGFCKEDQRLLDILGSSLGYLDLKMQTETLDLALLQTEDAMRIAIEQKENRGRLYQTLGVTVGIMLTLLII